MSFLRLWCVCDFFEVTTHTWRYFGRILPHISLFKSLPPAGVTIKIDDICLLICTMSFWWTTRRTRPTDKQTDSWEQKKSKLNKTGGARPTKLDFGQLKANLAAHGSQMNSLKKPHQTAAKVDAWRFYWGFLMLSFGVICRDRPDNQ